jgi:RNA polymerase sigma-70 factor, ECF subfamily
VPRRVRHTARATPLGHRLEVRRRRAPRRSSLREARRDGPASPRCDGARSGASEEGPSSPLGISRVSREAKLSTCAAPADDDTHRRIRALVNEYMDFVWRSLRRLGVVEADCDDGCQRVWVVLAQKFTSVEDAKMRSYVFSVVVRVASEMRRQHRRHQHLVFDELDAEPMRPEAEGRLERQRVLEVLDRILAELGWDLRTVFIMYEIEGMSSKEIADVLAISRGTVASRLRLGRAAFQRGLQRHQARLGAAGPTARVLTGKKSSGSSS